jgi:hypothetical protein
MIYLIIHIREILVPVIYEFSPVIHGDIAREDSYNVLQNHIRFLYVFFIYFADKFGL